MERVIRESELVTETLLLPIYRLTQIIISLYKYKHVESRHELRCLHTLLSYVHVLHVM